MNNGLQEFVAKEQRTPAGQQPAASALSLKLAQDYDGVTDREVSLVYNLRYPAFWILPAVTPHLIS